MSIKVVFYIKSKVVAIDAKLLNVVIIAIEKIE